MKIIKELFPDYRLGKADYLLGGILLLVCYFSFFQSDILMTGWNSLNYLFGNPFDFYENCKKIQGEGSYLVANYPPPVFIIFAVWLYPFKLLGLIKSQFFFSSYLVYWLKLLTSLIYIATGLVFYQITQQYRQDKNWGMYATWIWLTTPIAIFSQFIFSQYDIFYVFLTVLGFLFFLKKKSFFASLIFGLAITFKYFPLFVFLPLLVFFEKKIVKLMLCGLVFSLPTLLIQVLYLHSPTYISGVIEFAVLARVFAAGLVYSGQKIYYIFAIFLILIGLCYFYEPSSNYKKVAGFIFLFSSIFPFLFILWHPQWLIFITPAIALTTVLNPKKNTEKFLLFDLCSMIFFTAYTFLFFQDNVDLAMLQTKLFNISFIQLQNLGTLYKIFKGFSANIYLSLFWGYLILQCIIKFKLIDIKKVVLSYSYTSVRIRYYLGIFIFLIPMIFMFIKNINNKDLYIISSNTEKNFGELTSDRHFEQKFYAKSSKLKQVDLFLSAFSRENNNFLVLEILNSQHESLASFQRPLLILQNNAWEIFKFSPIALEKNKFYFLRLTAPKSFSGNAITWLASTHPSYIKGARVDGKQQNTDFAFKLRFENN